MAFDIQKIIQIAKLMKRQIEKEQGFSEALLPHMSNLINAWNGTHHKNALSFFNSYESATEFGINNVASPPILALSSILWFTGVTIYSVYTLGKQVYNLATGNLNMKNILSSMLVTLASAAITILITPTLTIGFTVNLLTRTLATGKKALETLHDVIKNASAEDAANYSPR